MAKIDRFNGNVQPFAAESLGAERTIFGDTSQSNTLDGNITSDFLRGWGIVGVNENPTKQDFNGLAFTLGQLISYLHQRGIPEWNSSQEFYEGSVVTTLDGIYRLKAGGNATVDPDTDAGVNWEAAPTRAELEGRVIRVTSISAMEAYSAPVGYVFSLNAGGRSGVFDVIAGDFSAELAADTQNGIYVGLSDNATATTKVTKRRYAGNIKLEWFGANYDGTTNDLTVVQAAELFGGTIDVTGPLLLGASATLSGDYIFNYEGKFVIGTGFSIKLNGAISAPVSHIFDITNGDITGNFVCDGDEIFPEWFGARKTSDDSVAINYAINYIQTYRRGGLLTLGSFSYQCSEPVVFSVDGAITMRGAGVKENTKIKSTVLDFTNASDTARGVVIEGSVAVAGVNLVGFLIQKDALVTVANSIGLHLKGAVNCSVYDVACNNFDINLVLDETSTIRTSRCSFKDFFSWDSRTGGFEIKGAFDNSFVSCFALGDSGGDWNIHFGGGTFGSDPNANHFKDCMFIDTGNPTRCLFAEVGFWNTFTSCVFEQASAETFRFQYSNQAATSIVSAMFTNCWSDAAPLCVLNVGANAVFTSCRLQATGPLAVSIEGVGSSRVRGSNKFIGNTIVAEGTGGTYSVTITKQSGTIFTGNSIEGPGDAQGLLLSGGAVSPDNSIITGNAFFKCTSSPVNDSSTGSSVANNTAEI